MRVKAGNKLSNDAQVVDFGSNADLSEVDGHVAVSGLGGSSLPAQTAGQFLYASDGSSGRVWGRALHVIDAAKEYGVTPGGIAGADQAAAIQNALDAANALTTGGRTGCVVQLPPGACKILSPLTIKEGTWLRGAGQGLTELYVVGASWTGGANPIIFIDSTQNAARISDMTIARDSGTFDAIQVDGHALFGSGGDYTTLENLFIFLAGTGGAGVKLQNGAIECRLQNVVCRVPGVGFYIGATDNFISNCTADTCGAEGFGIHAENLKFANCKAFGCGGSGFNIGGSGRNMFTACEAQDNSLYGFNDGTGDNVFSACVADTNGRTGAGGTMYGFMIGGWSTAVGCFAINRDSFPNQHYGFGGVVANGGVGTVIGTTRLMTTGAVNPAHRLNGIVNGVDLAGLPRSGTTTSSATPTINTDVVNYYTITALALAITSMTTNLSGTPTDGQELQIAITDNGTNRAITWGASFEASGTVALPTTTTASTRLDVSFVYNGATSKWRCVRVA